MFPLLVELFVLEIFKKKKKKKKKKKSSENEIKALKMTSQLVIFRAFQLVIFRAFFFFFPSPDPKSEKKNPVNQLIKKSGLTLIVFLKIHVNFEFRGICLGKKYCVLNLFSYRCLDATSLDS